MEVNDYESQEREKRYQSRKTATIPPNIFFVDLNFLGDSTLSDSEPVFLAVGRRFLGREKGRRNAPKFETQEEQEFPFQAFRRLDYALSLNQPKQSQASFFFHRTYVHVQAVTQS